MFDKSNSLRVGDTIQIGDTVLPVLGVLEDSPFSADDHPTVICSEALFEELTGKPGYAVVDVQLTADASRETVTELQALAGNWDFYDRMDLNRDTRNTYWMFCLFVYGFLAIITLITMIHTVNSISLSVAARTRQYAPCGRWAWPPPQLKAMIFAEAATYTVLGFAAGCGLGLPLHAFLYHQMITRYWGCGLAAAPGHHRRHRGAARLYLAGGPLCPRPAGLPPVGGREHQRTVTAVSGKTGRFDHHLTTPSSQSVPCIVCTFQHSFITATNSAGSCAHYTISGAVSLHFAARHSSPTRLLRPTEL